MAVSGRRTGRGETRVEARPRAREHRKADAAGRGADADDVRSRRSACGVGEGRLEALQRRRRDRVKRALLGVELTDRLDGLLFGRPGFDVLGSADLRDRGLLVRRDLLPAALHEGHEAADEEHDDHADRHDHHDAATTRASIGLRGLRPSSGRKGTLPRRLAEGEGIVHACWYRHPSDRLNPGTIAPMSELADVLAAVESLSARGDRMALATIVAVRGSTYRRPGARLLVPEEGAPIGNLSGGCLEGDVADMARVVMEEGKARLAGWDLTADDDAVWGLGLGCNGAIEVFIERADRAAEAARALRAALEEEQPVSLITMIESADRDTIAPGRDLVPAERSEIRTLPAGVRAFVEILEPPLRLVICGEGHDAIPLVRAASLLGWNATVVDDRPAFLDLERFPEAHAFALVDDPSEVAKAIPIDARTFVVVMTHNFLRDKEYLRSILTTDARYVAMLGPAARTQRVLMELEEEGTAIAEDLRARIHGPAGLDLGAEGPEEIAQAIVGEIVAVRRGRDGGFLRERPTPIHDRPRPRAEAR